MNEMNEDGRQPLNVFLGDGPAWIEYDGNSYYIHREGGSGCSYTIGDYELFDYVDRGSSALVYKALSKTSGDIVIIKELFPQDVFDADEIQRCGNRIVICEGVSPERAAEIRERYDHAFEEEKEHGIGLRYTDGLEKSDRFLSAKTELVYCDSSGLPMLNRYLVTDSAAGITLDMLDLSKITGRPRVKLIVKIIKKLCDTVSDMHEKELLHLDLSERNVFLRGDKRTLEDPGEALVALLDFGSSKQIGKDGSAVPGATSFSASEETASTEVKAIAVNGSAKYITPSSDVSSICQIFSQLLSRDIKNYSKGDKPNPARSASVKALSTGEQKELLHIINKGVNDIGRYASVEELKADLNRLLDDLELRGISRNIIRRSAEEKAAEMRRAMDNEGFDEKLLCLVQKVDKQA